MAFQLIKKILICYIAMLLASFLYHVLRFNRIIIFNIIVIKRNKKNFNLVLLYFNLVLLSLSISFVEELSFVFDDSVFKSVVSSFVDEADIDSFITSSYNDTIT